MGDGPSWPEHRFESYLWVSRESVGASSGRKHSRCLSSERSRSARVNLSRFSAAICPTALDSAVTYIVPLRPSKPLQAHPSYRLRAADRRRSPLKRSRTPLALLALTRDRNALVGPYVSRRTQPARVQNPIENNQRRDNNQRNVDECRKCRVDVHNADLDGGNPCRVAAVFFETAMERTRMNHRPAPFRQAPYAVASYRRGRGLMYWTSTSSHWNRGASAVSLYDAFVVFRNFSSLRSGKSGL